MGVNDAVFVHSVVGVPGTHERALIQAVARVHPKVWQSEDGRECEVEIDGLGPLRMQRQHWSVDEPIQWEATLGSHVITAYGWSIDVTTD
jgi:hypothetical protein